MSAASDTAQIRTLTRQEVEVAVAWAAQEGWNPGVHDAEAFYQTDPEGFLAVEENGEIVATVSSTAYGGAFGFMGFYIVAPEHRDRGYGMPLANAARARLGSRLIGIDGVLAMRPKYEQWGFQMAYCNARYEGVGGGEEPSGTVDIAQIAFEDLAAYDARYFPVPRERFLRYWLTQPDAVIRAVVRGAKIEGYGMLRPCQIGYKFGPIFAETPDIAETLFRALAAYAPGAPIFLDVPEPNTAAVALAKRHGMTKVFATARMYNREAPPLPLDGIFGVTSFELG